MCIPVIPRARDSRDIAGLKCQDFQSPEAFSRDSTKNLNTQGGAFTRALKFRKLHAPSFPGPRGAGNTNDQCINLKVYNQSS